MNIVPQKVRRALKSTLFAIIAWAAVMTPVVSYGAVVPETTESSMPEEFMNAPVSLDVVYGYQNTAKGGRFLPLKITLKNQAQEDFKGTLSIISLEPDFQGYSTNYEYDVYRYEYPVEMKAGETLTEAKSISLGSRVDQMYVSLSDENGEEIGRKRLKLNLNMDTAELFIGVLSDTPGQLLYLNNVGINYSTLRTKTIELSASTLPADELALDQLDVLLISDFRTRTLSGQQVEAVWEWVQKGGVLLFGGGEGAEETLMAFSDKILEAPLPQPEEYLINMGEEYGADQKEEEVLPLICTEIMLKDGTELITDEDFTVLSSMSSGNGIVAAAVYDFKDIGSFCENHISYIDNLFTSLLGENRINRLGSSMGSSTSDRFWSVQGLINSGNITKLPKVGLYVILAASYVALAGPGLYFFLKQRELRQYYQLSVALLSLCCTGMVMLMGMTTRFTGPFFTYITIQEADEKEVSEISFINMRAPFNKPYAVELDPSYAVYPLNGSPYYDRTPVPKFTGEEDADITLRFGAEETRIHADRVGSFKSKYFQLEKTGENKGGVGFTGDIHAFDGQITGSLTNHYDQAVENVAVLLYNQMLLIDEMEPGETVILDDLKVLYCPTNFSYAMAAQITGSSAYNQGGDIRDAGYVEAMERTNLLSFYISSYLSGYHTQARVVGFARDKEDTQFLKEGSYETYGNTLLTSSVDVDYEQNGQIYQSAMQKKPNILSGEYYDSNNTIYGLSPVMLEYYLGNDIQVEKLAFHQISEEMVQSMQYYYTVPFTGTMSFYNYNTGSYDPQDLSVTEYDSDSLKPYLSPGNTLTVKYVYDATGDYTLNIMLPVLTVTGRSK